MAADLRAYWAAEPAALIEALGSGPGGLSADAAAARRTAAAGLPASTAGGPRRLLLRQLQSPLVLILVAGASVSLVVREWVDAAIILAIVLGSVALGFLQEYRASRAVAALRSQLALRVRVVRDGREQVVPAPDVVPGDIVLLAAGNLVPGDGVVLEARDFLVVESSLTGESFPVEKRPGTVPESAPLTGRSNAVFLGTSVRSGTARVLLVRTGADTELGAIAGRLASAEPETAFARGIRQFGYLLLRVMLVMVVFVLVVNEWLGRPLLESLLFAMALAVGLSPELLPAIVSVTLSRGAREMARRGVIVARLEAIEDLGSMDVLCTDKTGTLTVGVLELEGAVGPDGQPDAGVLRLAALNARLETGIENPLDAAIVAAADRAGVDAAGITKVDEIPYDFIRKRLTIVVAGADAADAHLVITKGAFAEVLSGCTHVEQGGEARPLDAALRQQFEGVVRARGDEGCRVLALATRRIAARTRYGFADEAGMTFRGFLVFRDPPKPGAAAAIAALAAAGVRTKVITGDNRYVSAHLAREVGLDPAGMVTGNEIAAMRDEALWQRAEAADLFVEVDPQQKERIVRALQQRGHAVGYLGDGINDAPALRAADVGISVSGAVDVARESADVVLLGPDLDVLRMGVADGRHTFANTLKYIGITTSANFGNMVSMAMATPLLPFLPLAAKQILLNNFLSDVPSIFISSDRVDREQLVVPRQWRLREVRRFMLVFGLLSTVFDLATFAVLLLVFEAGEALFQTAWFVVSLLTELAVVLSLRTSVPCWRSVPSGPLLAATVLVGFLGMASPYLGGASALFGLVPLPAALAAAMALIVGAYLLATEVAKAWFFRRWSALY
ncbi:MAG: magnesium-translocating P-type ATPase [Chromatiales bacterium]|jgi:Mg2+-importing ATPase|nr:magnesium-translocating P-type ATPase [Chromatiales bacterium]